MTCTIVDTSQITAVANIPLINRANAENGEIPNSINKPIKSKEIYRVIHAKNSTQILCSFRLRTLNSIAL
jgi:hypothetical protein